MQHKQHIPLPLVEGVDIVESEEDLQLKNTISSRNFTDETSTG